jgi:hypothetical protein
MTKWGVIRKKNYVRYKHFTFWQCQNTSRKCPSLILASNLWMHLAPLAPPYPFKDGGLMTRVYRGIETCSQIVPLFFKSFHFWVSYVTFWNFLKIPSVFRVKPCLSSTENEMIPAKQISTEVIISCMFMTIFVMIYKRSWSNSVIDWNQNRSEYDIIFLLFHPISYFIATLRSLLWTIYDKLHLWTLVYYVSSSALSRDSQDAFRGAKISHAASASATASCSTCCILLAATSKWRNLKKFNYEISPNCMNPKSNTITWSWS